MSEHVIGKLEEFRMENPAIPDDLHPRSIGPQVVSDLGKPVADMWESSLKSQGAQVAGAGLNTPPVFVIILTALHCLSSGLLDKLYRHITAAFRDVKPILEREILESCDRVNV